MIYSNNYHRLTLPLLIINGSWDEIGVTSVVKYVFDQSTSIDRIYRQFGVNGREIIISNSQNSDVSVSDTYDYGHLDLVVGKEAPREVYPYVYNWLISRI
ncbi:hypothetical protein ACFL27_24215 [candidate division CSSED10-310 bacterium]|uniref:Alpha/beta hydrolase n=1 Tax=candidate division CSSED10-310 bacterium TaxID=2855610 RepID=A0ABV6Z4E1_UNCC1